MSPADPVGWNVNSYGPGHPYLHSRLFCVFTPLLPIDSLIHLHLSGGFSTQHVHFLEQGTTSVSLDFQSVEQGQGCLSPSKRGCRSTERPWMGLVTPEAPQTLDG